MVKDPSHVWIGLEYFCNVGDPLWSKADAEFMKFAIDELAQIGIINKEAVIDSTILREEKTYPAYFGTYDRFEELKTYVNRFENLFLVGRNGMHKYNNSDHSMLTAMTAVDNIIAGKKEKDNIWSINTEQEYHEKK
jgi:protoporphyrinogen oxidase